MGVNLATSLNKLKLRCSLCVESIVAYADKSMCRRSPVVELRQSRGFLSNLVADETGCGSFDSAWWLSAKPGQRLRLTLYDFPAAAAAVDQSSSSSAETSASSSVSASFSGRHRHGSSIGSRMAICR